MESIKSLTDVGVSEESARLALYQFQFLKDSSPEKAKEYQNLVSDTVVGLKDRLLAYYKNKIDNADDMDFLADDYIPVILQNNLNSIIRSFDNNYGGLLKSDASYSEMINSVGITGIYTGADSRKGVDYLKQSIENASEIETPQQKQGVFSRIKESVTSMLGKSKIQATTSTRQVASRQTTQKKQGVFSHAVSVIKKLFRR